MNGAEAEPSQGPAGVAVDTGSLIVEAREITRTFGHGETAVHAVRGASFTIRQGQLVALIGRCEARFHSRIAPPEYPAARAVPSGL